MKHKLQSIQGSLKEKAIVTIFRSKRMVIISKCDYYEYIYLKN